MINSVDRFIALLHASTQQLFNENCSRVQNILASDDQTRPDRVGANHPVIHQTIQHDPRCNDNAVAEFCAGCLNGGGGDCCQIKYWDK